MKLLLWAVIVLVIVAWLFRSKKNSSGSSEAPPPKTGKPSHDELEPMLPCAHCGIHVPASEAVMSSSGAAFCSQEHRLGHSRS